MKIHELKTRPEIHHDVSIDRKRFEIRFNDRSFITGDLLLLEAYDEDKGGYLDRQKHPPVLVRITYMLGGSEWGGLREAYVAMGIERVMISPAGAPPPR